jgi:hypothetical protein
VSSGELARLDWSRAQVGDPQPCIFCRHDAILRHPITMCPAHKVCSDRRRQALLEKAARQATKGNQ